VLNYRHQLEIIAILIYLATNDTKLIFDRNKPTERENHWEITTFLNEEILCQMLYSYHLKLKTELAKIGKFTNAEIEYQEFSPKTFNLAREMKKPELPTILSIKTFPNKRDSQNIENFSETLYNRYLEGIELANKRLRELTIKLRIQKESSSSGKIKKANILEMNAEITEMQNEIKELQQKIAFYHPKEIITVDPFLKVEYDKFVKEIQTMMSNRIEKTTFIKNLLLILTTSVCIYPFLYLTNPYDISQLILLFLILIIPSGIYTMLQMKYSIRTKNKITKKISEFINYNEKTINDLFCNDKETAIYVQNIYNLIMLKKYVNECNSKLLEHSKKLKQLNYHYAKLKEHIETNNRLLEILAIKNSVIEPIKTDKINELDIEKTFEKNSLYCPLNYLLLVDNIKNKATINQEQNVDINSNLIGFVEKFIITYDKEYHHD